MECQKKCRRPSGFIHWQEENMLNNIFDWSTIVMIIIFFHRMFWMVMSVEWRFYLFYIYDLLNFLPLIIERKMEVSISQEYDLNVTMIGWFSLFKNKKVQSTWFLVGLFGTEGNIGLCVYLTIISYVFSSMILQLYKGSSRQLVNHTCETRRKSQSYINSSS